MLTIQFIEQNLHFAISLFASIVFFAVFWLYFDAWNADAHKHKKDAIKWAGFLLVSISFLLNATIVEQTGLTQPIFGNAAAFIALVIRVAGYLLVIIGQVIDPLQPVPINKGLAEEYGKSRSSKSSKTRLKASPALALNLGGASQLGAFLLLPVQALAIALVYWRRATMGLEHHLKPVAYAFMLIFGFESLSVAELFRATNNPAIYDMVKAFGPIWITGNILLLAAALVLGRWVWRYLTERFISQLFMTFIGVVLSIFLVTTVSFSFLLLQNIQNNALGNLASATSVLNYALDSKKASTEANAEAVAANPALDQAIIAKDHQSLVNLTSSFLASKQESSLVITNADGQVLLRAEDPARWGDSISSDTLFRRAIIGSTSSTVESQSAVLAPVISIRSVSPIRDAADNIVGTVSVSTIINNAFVDGIKHSTGLDSAVYSENIRSATTFTAPDGTSRWIGIKETNDAVNETVLQHGQTYTGELSILNRQYLAAYAPLKDVDNMVIGMIFIGQPEVVILQTTTYLFTITFVIAAILLVLSIIPAYAVARYINYQLE